MPGIVGLVTKKPLEWASDQLVRMVETLSHESFYTAGTWIDESSGVYVGWTAQENSFSVGMPLRSERGDVVLVFSGEEFPAPGTTEDLKNRGHEFDLAGASYLVHLYQEDRGFPIGLNGRFQGVLTDQNRKSTVLFNDRYGMHRVYYHESKDAFYFAAEAKAILAVRPELRRMDTQAAGELVACGSVLENRTIFEGIRVLPPASAWVFRNGSLDHESSYFHPREWEDQDSLDSESYYRDLREVFAVNLPRYFNGHQRIAMSLTGGLDTRIIMAWQKHRPESLPCYTFGGMFRDCEDVRVARQVARACSQSHQVIRLGEEFLSKFPHYAERAVYLTDGCVDVGRAADLYLSERARAIGPVRMTGNYGGEVLRRVHAFRPEEPLPGLFAPEILWHVRRTSETYASLVRGHPVTFAAFKQAPWHHFGVLALEQTQLCTRSPYLDNELVRTAFRAPESALATSAASQRLIAEGNPALLRIRTDRGLAGNRGPLLGGCSRTVLEFLFKAEYAYDIGMPQWMAQGDHILSSFHLERVFLGRHKYLHFRVWYRDVLAEYVREMLLDRRSLSRPYIERKGLEAVVRGHLKGERNYTTEIHRLLTLELLQRLFFDNPESSGPGAGPGVPVASGVTQ